MTFDQAHDQLLVWAGCVNCYYDYNDTWILGHEQAISFALVNVISAVLGLAWVAFYMVTASPALAILSLAVTPLMFFATVYFSSQARKAFRRFETKPGEEMQAGGIFLGELLAVLERMRIAVDRPHHALCGF